MEKLKEIFMYSLAGLATLVFLTLAILVFFITIPETNKDIAIFLLGQFAGIVVMIYSYFFGSSKGSADKTASLNKQAEAFAENTVSKTTETTDSKTN